MPKTSVTVETFVYAPAQRVWECWTKPEHVTKWNQASPDWHCPRGESDLREGGTFSFRMEAKDGSMGFDFGGTYTSVAPEKRLSYVMADGRAVTVTFEERDGGTRVSETFDAEGENPVEMQRGGWQAILDAFRAYVQSR